MKKTVLSIAMLGLVAQTFAQDVLYEAKIKKEEVPAAIVEAIETDFPEYVMEEVYTVPVDYVKEDVVVDKSMTSTDDDYDTFDIELMGKGEELTATYGEDGKLLNSKEYEKNVKLPKAVAKSIAKKFPGWAMTKDTYKMSHKEGGKQMERYRVVIKMGDDTMRIITDENGKIMNKPQISK